MTPLAQFLNESGQTPEQFAVSIDVDPVTVRRYLNGTRRPSWIVMPRIVAATAGRVTADSFLLAAKRKGSFQAA